MFPEFHDLTPLFFYSGVQPLQFSLQVQPLLHVLGRIILTHQILVLADKHTTHTHRLLFSMLSHVSGWGFHNICTHKLICPSSSCRARIRSDRDPRVGAASSGSLLQRQLAVGRTSRSLWRFFLAPQAAVCSALMRSHSWGWWCFIMWRIPWTLAWTEWLGLVDWKTDRTVEPMWAESFCCSAAPPCFCVCLCSLQAITTETERHTDMMLHRFFSLGLVKNLIFKHGHSAPGAGEVT